MPGAIHFVVSAVMLGGLSLPVSTSETSDADLMSKLKVRFRWTEELSLSSAAPLLP